MNMEQELQKMFFFDLRKISKNRKSADFSPCLQHKDEVFRKNKLNHEKQDFLRFSKHRQLLSVAFVKHECQPF
jgi:hypothetical protein